MCAKRRRQILLALGVALVSVNASYSQPLPHSKPTIASERNRSRKEIRERAIVLEHRKRTFPLGYIPDGAMARALQQTRETEAKDIRPFDIFPNWYNIGPAPLRIYFYPAPVAANSGRVAALAVDPLNRTHLLLGAAQGGVWESTNSGGMWYPRTDDQPSLAMGAIAFAPSNPLFVYAGTGEPNFRGDDFAGGGLLASTDGGTHWILRNASFAQTAFSAVRVDSSAVSNLVVATVRAGAGVTDAAAGSNVPPSAPPRGIFKSSDGGGTFVRVLTGEATDLQVDPGNYNHQYAALGEIYGADTNGVYRTLSGWGSSQLISGPWTTLATPLQMGRIVMALAPSAPNTLYVGVSRKRVNYVADIVGIWRSTNAWDAVPSWDAVSNPPLDYSHPEDDPRFWYNFSLLVDPIEPSTLYLGEEDVWRYASGLWTPIGDDIHPDNHAMAWVPTGTGNYKLLLGNDGGVWITAVSGTVSWFDLNPTLAISQCYKGAIDPTSSSRLVMAGLQDNGTPYSIGDRSWPMLYGGDGADCAVATGDPSHHWAVSAQSGAIYRTLTGGRPVSAAYSPILAAPYYQQFFVHFEKSPRNDNLFIAGTDKLWRCNNFFSATIPSWLPNGPAMTHSGVPVPISAMAFAPTDATGMIYAFGTEDGQLRITQNGGGAWADLDAGNAVPDRYISGLAFSPTNAGILYVTLSGFDEGTPGHPGHLFKTANALAPAPTWSNVSPPVNLPNNCMVIDPINPALMYVGTDIGVWRSTSDSFWTHYGPSSGMPNVAVFDLRMNTNGFLVAFTHGRSTYAFSPGLISVIVWVPYCLICPLAPCLSCPYENWANPGDLINFQFPLRNVTPADTGNLTATLLQTSQVTPVNGIQSYGVLKGQGDPVERIFSFRASKLPNGSCGDTLQLVFQLQDEASSYGQISVPYRLGVPNYPLAQDFEQSTIPALPQGWLSSNTPSMTGWTTTTNPLPSELIDIENEDIRPPPTVSVITSATNIGQSYLVSPTFTVATSNAQLYFQQAFDLVATNNGAILEIAVGNQLFQDITQAGGSFKQMGYNALLSGNNPLGARLAWSGDSGGWLPVYVNLPPSAVGQQVKLRWRLATSTGDTNGFWSVDTALVTEPLCPPPVTNPVIVSPTLHSNTFSFSINTVSNRAYVVEVRTNINDLQWQYWQTLTGSGFLQTINVPVQNTSQRYFRFRLQ
jgi:hypothetical protein